MTNAHQRVIISLGDNMKFDEYLRSKGFTVRSLAKKAGVSHRTLEQYSSGRYPLKNARAWLIVALADALETTPKELISLDD